MNMRTIENEKLKRRYFDEEAVNSIIPEKLYAYCELMEFEKGEMIVKRNAKPRNLYFMMEGKCSISNNMANGEIYIQSIAKAPCMIGEIELLEFRNNAMDVKAVEDCMMLAFPYESCRDILIHDALFLRKLCIDLVHKERQVSMQLSQMNAYPFKNRLAFFILNNAVHDEFNVKKTEISRSLGVSYRHTEKVMNDFVEEGILLKKGTHYRINKREILEKLSDRLMEDIV